MKKILLLSFVFALFLSQGRSQNCIHYELAQDDIGIPSATFGVSIADFNGDGWNDVVTIDAYSDIEIYYNNGDGTIDTNAHILGEERWRFGVQVLDIDNDGDMDFVTAPMSSKPYGIEVWKNIGNGVFILKSDNTARYSSGHELAVGDLNGDGYVDIFFPNSDKVGIYLNDGTGNFEDNGQELEASSPESAALFDADNDGDLDAVVARGFPAKFYTNDGTGHFTETQNNMADDAEGVAAADFNGDGFLDIVFAPWHGYIEIWYNDGLGSFLPGDTIFEGGSEFFNDVIAKDVNFDNYPDIITDINILLNDPENPGNFFPAVEIPSGSTHDFEMGDFNNDSLPDIYIGRFSSNNGDILDLYQPGTIIEIDTTLCYGDSILIRGIWRKTPGNYVASGGCDTIIRINLSFHPPINTGVTVHGDTLIAKANGPGITYQWVNCADTSAIEGATNQMFIATQTGDYAVIISKGECSAISDCYNIIVTDLPGNTASDIRFYPNPVREILTIDKIQENNTRITITDITGRIVIRQLLPEGKSPINVSGLKPGVYFLAIFNKQESTIHKIIKE